jgi:hypothetical protein
VLFSTIIFTLYLNPFLDFLLMPTQTKSNI